MRFSQRTGYAPVKSTLQREVLDAATRAGLWDVLGATVLPERVQYLTSEYALARQLWHGYFKQPLDEISHWWPDVVVQLRK